MLTNEEKELGEFTASIRQLLATGNPNPKRTSCSQFTKRIRTLAWHGKPDRDLAELLNHLSHCSPCFRDHRWYKRQYRLYQGSKRIIPYAMAAVALFLAGIQFQATRKRHSPTVETNSNAGLHLPQIQKGKEGAEVQLSRAVTLNLESNLRGEGEGQLITTDLPRDRFQLTLQLPRGARPGKYAVRLSMRPKERLIDTEGIASIDEKSDTILQVNEFDTSTISPGKYQLSLKRGSLDWVDFEVRVK